MVDTSQYRRAVGVELRTFERFEDDGKPNPPGYAPLPLGDPKSGLHLIDREGLREVFEPIPDLVDQAATDADRAEVARNLAVDAAETVVYASEVPIVPTRALAVSMAIPAGWNSFRTNGYAVTGDGGGAFYVADAIPGPGGITDATPTTARTFRLAEREVTPAMFGGNTTDMNTYIAALGATAPQVFSPAVHIFSDLGFRRFRTKAGAFDSQTAELQNAIDALISDTRYRELDLEGQNIVVEDTIRINHANVSGAARYPLTVRNGTIFAAQGSWAAKDQPIIHFSHSGGGTIQDWNLEQLTLQAGSGDAGYSSGVLIDGPYLSMRLRRCMMKNMAIFGLRSRNNGGSGQNLRIEQCDIISSHSGSMPFADRTCLGLDLDQDGDGKVFHTRIVMCKTAVRGAIGSYLFTGNHFWQGRNTNETQNGFNPLVQMGARANSSFVCNYLDNGHIQFDEGLIDNGTAAGGQGYCTFVGNRFTIANSGAGECFIKFRPTSSASKLANLFVKDNEIRVLGARAETMTAPFQAVPVRSGYIATATAENVHIYDNYFWGAVTAQTSRPEKYIAMDGTKTNWWANVSGQTPFGLQANTAHALAVTSASNPGAAWYSRGGAYDGYVKTTNPVVGTAKLTLDCNARGEI